MAGGNKFEFSVVYILYLRLFDTLINAKVEYEAVCSIS
jgi:hypothetical protein